MSDRKIIIEWAKSQVGIAETPNNINPYAADIDANYPNFYNGKKQGAAWCDVFVDYGFIKCYGEDEAYRLTCQPKKSCGAGCYYSYGYYKKKKQTSKAPSLGAQIFFSSDGTEKGISHTGLVVGVDNSYVYTVEGNKNNKVSACTYKRNASNIYGYGVPAYGDEVAEAPKAEATRKSVDEIAQEVILGKWGNGAVRKSKLESAGYNYNEVQKKVNAILSASKAPTTSSKTVCVSTSLNVRATPNGSILGQLRNGEKVEVIAEENGWSKIKYNGGNCYVFSKYLK